MPCASDIFILSPNPLGLSMKMSELWPNVFSVIRYSAIQVETLADALGQELLCAPADPFAEDLILTRSGAIGRWLTQRLSMSLGSSGHGDGVCARVRFLTFTSYAGYVRGGDDPWSADLLVPEVMAAMDEMVSQDGFAQVGAYLGDGMSRPRRRVGFSRSTANRFSSYAKWNIDMLRSWDIGDFVGPDGSPLGSSQRWQAHLWNRVCQRVGSTPWEDAERLCESAMSSAAQFSRIAVFCPDVLCPLDERLLTALDSVHPVLAFSLPCASPVDESDFSRISRKMTQQLTFTTSVLDRLALEDRTLPEIPGPNTLLTSIQHRLITGELSHAVLDDSVHIHSGYGDQQADILADLLTSLLEDDPELEPRDILVLVHRMESHQRMLEAFFRPDSRDSSARHQIRASVSASEPETNTAEDLLIFVAGLVQGRATAEDLLRLVGFGSVMSQFGFSDADLDKISTLISSSGIRWGLNPAHRANQHMESFAQNTWMAGLGRMVLGVGLSEDDLVFKGTVLPLDAVDSDTVRIVEALGQIIAHVRMCCETWTAPAGPPEWASRFRTTLDFLTGSAWETTPAGQTLTNFGATSSPPLTLEEAESLFVHIRTEQVRRSSFLNGDLALAELGTMSLVPHKVVVVFGLDADSFPHQPTADGDDLAQCVVEDSRTTDLQIFYDALISAREKFIAVYAGFDPATAAPTPMPTPLLDLVSLVESCSPTGSAQGLVHVHSPLEASTHVRTRSVPEPLRALIPVPTEVEIDDLAQLYTNPAAYWLRRNAGLLPSVLKETDPMETEIPMALSPLDKWQIVTRMIHLLLAQKTPDAILQAELRRGTLPPGQMGISVAQDCVRQASAIVGQAKPLLDQPLSWRTISLDSPDVPDLVGQIPVHGTTVLDTLAGRVQPRQEIGAWASILSLKVAYPDQVWRAVLVGNRGTVTLTSPDPIQARRHLDYLRQIHLKGLVSPLPLPPSASAHVAKFMARRQDWKMSEVERRLEDIWAREPSWSMIWPTPAAMLAEPPQSGESAPHESSTSRFMALTHGVYVPMMRAGGVS